MARVEAYLHAKFHLDPSNRLATVNQHHRQDRQWSDSIGRTVPINRRHGRRWHIVANVLSITLQFNKCFAHKLHSTNNAIIHNAAYSAKSGFNIASIHWGKFSENLRDKIHCVQKKHPLLFSFVTSSQIDQFAQTFQHL